MSATNMHHLLFHPHDQQKHTDFSVQYIHSQSQYLNSKEIFNICNMRGPLSSLMPQLISSSPVIFALTHQIAQLGYSVPCLLKFWIRNILRKTLKFQLLPREQGKKLHLKFSLYSKCQHMFRGLFFFTFGYEYHEIDFVFYISTM